MCRYCSGALLTPGERGPERSPHQNPNVNSTEAEKPRHKGEARVWCQSTCHVPNTCQRPLPRPQQARTSRQDVTAWLCSPYSLTSGTFYLWQS